MDDSKIDKFEKPIRIAEFNPENTFANVNFKTEVTSVIVI